MYAFGCLGSMSSGPLFHPWLISKVSQDYVYDLLSLEELVTQFIHDVFGCALPDIQAEQLISPGR